jgi:hypothetical protein
VGRTDAASMERFERAEARVSGGLPLTTGQKLGALAAILNDQRAHDAGNATCV